MSTNQVDFGNEDWLGYFLFAKTISLSQILQGTWQFSGSKGFYHITTQEFSVANDIVLALTSTLSYYFYEDMPLEEYMKHMGWYLFD